MDSNSGRRSSSAGRWRIGELAILAGTSARAIRLYHKEGLLPEPTRTDSGYRLYRSTDLASLIRVRRLRSLGFNIDQIRELVSVSEPSDFSQALEALRADLGRRIQQLRAAIKVLDQLQSEGAAERELFTRLAPTLRAVVDSSADPDLSVSELAPLREGLTKLERQPQWPGLQQRLRLLRDTSTDADDLERLAEQLAKALPPELLPDQLADPLMPTILLGGRFSRQQIDVLHRAAEIQRSIRRRRR